MEFRIPGRLQEEKEDTQKTQDTYRVLPLPCLWACESHVLEHLKVLALAFAFAFGAERQIRHSTVKTLGREI